MASKSIQRGKLAIDAIAKTELRVETPPPEPIYGPADHKNGPPTLARKWENDMASMAKDDYQRLTPNPSGKHVKTQHLDELECQGMPDSDDLVRPVKRNDPKLVKISSAQSVPSPSPPPTQTASIPAIITRRMEAALRGRGFSKERINGMTPAEAWEILQSTTPEAATCTTSAVSPPTQANPTAATATPGTPEFEAEAHRLADQLERLHQDGAIPNMSAEDPEACFYANLLRSFDATYIGKIAPRVGGIGRIEERSPYGLSRCEVLFLRAARSRANVSHMAKSSSSSASKPVKVRPEAPESLSDAIVDCAEKAPTEGQVTVLDVPKFKNLNQRQELFCQHIAAGLSGVEAFKRVTPGSPRDCDVKAAQMRRKPGVEARIRELMRENDKKSEMSRQEALQWLSAVIRTSPAKLQRVVHYAKRMRRLRMAQSSFELSTKSLHCNNWRGCAIGTRRSGSK